MAWKRFSGMCALRPWPRIYIWMTIRSRSWHTFGSWKTIVWNIILIQKSNEEFGPDTDFWYVCTVTLALQIMRYNVWPWSSEHKFWICMHSDLDLRDMTLGQGHDTPLGHGQQLCEIISTSDKGLSSYGPDAMWIDGQGDSYILVPLKFVCRGKMIIWNVFKAITKGNNQYWADCTITFCISVF